MRKSNNILLGWVAFVYVVAHSCAIFIYAFPAEYIHPSLKAAVNGYVSPIFEQTWSLFAPCPLNENQMRVRYYFDDDSTDWVNPIGNASEMHAMFRCTYHGELALAQSNLLYYIGNDVTSMGLSMYEPFPADSASKYQYYSSYWMTRQFVYGTADYLYGKKPVRALTECSFRNVKTGENGTLTLPEYKWEVKND